MCVCVFGLSVWHYLFLFIARVLTLSVSCFTALHSSVALSAACGGIYDGGRACVCLVCLCGIIYSYLLRAFSRCL